jgi:hypothetical protein
LALKALHSRWSTLATAAVCLAGTAFAQAPVRFRQELYPIFEKANCHRCHVPEGVASGTRLHFPPEGASPERIDRFGESLVTLVDRRNPEQSLLLRKPTNRLAHGGSERIAAGSPEEALLQRWVTHLATMPEARVKQALEYRKSEATSYSQGGRAVLRRLTHQQYANTVRDLLKEATDVSSQFPPEDFVNGFKNQYQSQSLSPTLIEAYSETAERLAGNVFRRGDSRKLIPCDYQKDPSGCRMQWLRSFGRRAFRRPLEPQEFARYEALFQSEGDFLHGARAVIEAMLQAPSFLFWMDQTPRASWKPYAMASRLAYGLWNSTPDDALLDRAEKGELQTPAGVASVARQLLKDPKARQGLDEFTAQWLRFDRALAAARERRTFPMFSRELVTSMLEEDRRFVADLVWNDRDFMDLFRAGYGFVNGELATVYNVPAPATDFERVVFPKEQERAGVLGHALFLTLTSKPEDTAPTSRGMFIREQFLCQQVPPPPPGVDTNLPPLEEAVPRTNRERLAQHTVNKACSSCHALIDPLGFAFEKFDAVGIYHPKAELLFYPDEHEAKVPKKKVLLDLDTSGNVTGVPDSNFQNPRELGEILARAAQCQQCVVQQVFRYQAGRHELRSDAPLIQQVLADFRTSGLRFQELLVSYFKHTADATPPEGVTQ